jgi:hypothetical protein
MPESQEGLKPNYYRRDMNSKNKPESQEGLKRRKSLGLGLGGLGGDVPESQEGLKRRRGAVVFAVRLYSPRIPLGQNLKKG